MPRVPLPRGAELGPGRVTIEGVPATFAPGERYTLTITLTRAGMKLAGFQLAARFKDSGAQAGTLAPGPGDGGTRRGRNPGRRPIRGPEEGGGLGRRGRRGDGGRSCGPPRRAAGR